MQKKEGEKTHQNSMDTTKNSEEEREIRTTQTAKNKEEYEWLGNA